MTSNKCKSSLNIMKKPVYAAMNNIIKSETFISNRK